MVNLSNMKCPYCGDRLDWVNPGTSDQNVRCRFCGSIYNLKNKEEWSRGNNSNSAAPENKTAAMAADESVAKSGNISRKKIIIIYAAASVAAFAILTLVNFVNKAKHTDVDSLVGEETIDELEYEDEYEYGEDIDDYGSDNRESGEADEKSIAEKEVTEDIYPATKLFRSLIENVFGVECDKVTQSQIDSITYIEVSNEGNYIIFDYKINDGEIMQTALSNDLYGDYADLGYFRGLKTINIKGSIYNADLSGLKDLEEIWANNTPEEIAGYVSNPSNIKIMGCYKTDEELSGIDKFNNLECLYIDSYSLEDIGELKKLTRLKTLQIDSGNSQINYDIVGEMTSLEHLTLRGYYLNDISFLSGLTNLIELDIASSSVSDISVLSKLKGLKKLNIADNSYIESFDVVCELKGLEELGISIQYGQEFPGNIESLKTLHIKGPYDMEFVKYIPNVKSLYVEDYYGDGLENIGNLTQLKELELDNCYMDKLDFLEKLTQLKSIRLNELEIYENIDFIFNLPSIGSIEIDSCSFGLDAGKVNKNDNIKKLSVNSSRLLVNFSTADYGDRGNFNDISAFIGNFENLEELSVQYMELENVDFALGLKKLRNLDITDNIINDISPLNKLDNLRIIRCGGNALNDDVTLSNDAQILTESEIDSYDYDEWWVDVKNGF